jgi:hypothetical protein
MRPLFTRGREAAGVAVLASQFPNYEMVIRGITTKNVVASRAP